MNRALALVESDTATKALVHEAGELAAGVGAELLLLHVTTEDEFEEQSDALAGLAEYADAYGSANARDGAQQFARDIGTEVLEGIDVDWRPIGALGDTATEVVDVADEFEADHVFISGRERSPAGKAIFGDIAQDVILNFDGTVTVTTD
jgi:nucleotide-binding universal stress UspA family protein